MTECKFKGGTRGNRASSLQVQGLGDILEIEENTMPGDDGVKIQAQTSRVAKSFSVPLWNLECLEDIIYKYIEGEQNLQAGSELSLLLIKGFGTG